MRSTPTPDLKNERNRQAQAAACHDIMRPAFTIIAVSFGIAALFVPTKPFVIWNASPSIATGAYVRSSGAVTTGAVVTVEARVVAPHYAAHRQFDDPSDFFIKRVLAGSGAEVCSQASSVRVDEIVLTRFSHDREGLALPAWSGCRRLRAGEIFLVGDTPDSFDSRYFGPVQVSSVTGVWRKL